MTRLFIAVVVAVLGWTSTSLAQTPFTDSRQAAGDQYGVTAPPTPTTTTPTPTTDGGGDTDADDGGVAGDRDAGGNGSQGAGDGAGNARGGGNSGSGANAGGAGAGGPAVAGRSTIGFLSTRGSLEDLLTGILGRPGLSVELGGVDENVIGDLAAGTPFAGLGGGDLDEDKLAGFAEALGADLVRGGQLAARFASAVESDGVVRPLTALVATRDVDGLSDAQKTIADALLKGMLEGAVEQDVPVIGVEESDNDPSNVAFFKDVEDVSVVDHVDTPEGQATLKALVAGAKPGHYGTEKDADAVTAPTIDPDTSSAVVTGEGDGGGMSLILVIGLCAMALVAGRLVAVKLRRPTPLA